MNAMGFNSMPSKRIALVNLILAASIHTKFIDTFSQKAEEELMRAQHYAGSVEYIAYADELNRDPQLWCKWSERYINWRQLEILGLMSKGNWA